MRGRDRLPPDERESADRELVQRFQHGADAEGAFLALYRSYRSVTSSFFQRRVGDPQVAADLNQDLYLDVLEGLAGFRGDSSFRTWLFRLAHNRLGHLRRRWRTHLDECAGEPPDALRQQLAASGEGADETLERAERARRLRDCLAALPEIERAVVLGQYYRGITLEDLTRQLGLANPSGARAVLLAAQRRLRRCLERAGERRLP